MPGNGAPLIPFSLMSRRRMGTVIGAVNATRTARARENASLPCLSPAGNLHAAGTHERD